MNEVLKGKFYEEYVRALSEYLGPVNEAEDARLKKRYPDEYEDAIAQRELLGHFMRELRASEKEEKFAVNGISFDRIAELFTAAVYDYAQEIQKREHDVTPEISAIKGIKEEVVDNVSDILGSVFNDLVVCKNPGSLSMRHLLNTREKETLEYLEKFDPQKIAIDYMDDLEEAAERAKHGPSVLDPLRDAEREAIFTALKASVAQEMINKGEFPSEPKGDDDRAKTARSHSFQVKLNKRIQAILTQVVAEYDYNPELLNQRGPRAA